jgi:hypothetical protein
MNPGSLMGSLNFNPKSKPNQGFNRSNSGGGRDSSNWQSNTGNQNKSAGANNGSMPFNMQAIQAQLLMRGNAAAALGIRPPAPNSNVFGLQQPPQQPPQNLNMMFSGNQSNRNHRDNTRATSTGASTTNASPFMDQKAKQRAEVLKQAQAFLNPGKSTAAATPSAPAKAESTAAPSTSCSSSVVTPTAPSPLDESTALIEQKAPSVSPSSEITNTEKPASEEQPSVGAETMSGEAAAGGNSSSTN